MSGDVKDNTDENGSENNESEYNESENDVAEALADGDIVVDFDETVGDLAAVLSVEKLEAKVDSADMDEVAEKAQIRRRLEELRQQREADLDGTFNIKMDDD